jgi:hypothetical protein
MLDLAALLKPNSRLGKKTLLNIHFLFGFLIRTLVMLQMRV